MIMGTDFAQFADRSRDHFLEETASNTHLPVFIKDTRQLVSLHKFDGENRHRANEPL